MMAVCPCYSRCWARGTVRSDFSLPSKISRPIVSLVLVCHLGVLQDLVTITLSNLPVLTPVSVFHTLQRDCPSQAL